MKNIQLLKTYEAMHTALKEQSFPQIIEERYQTELMPAWASSDTTPKLVEGM
jgi:hypothetical protein